MMKVVKMNYMWFAIALAMFPLSGIAAGSCIASSFLISEGKVMPAVILLCGAVFCAIAVLLYTRAHIRNPDERMYERHTFVLILSGIGGAVGTSLSLYLYVYDTVASTPLMVAPSTCALVCLVIAVVSSRVPPKTKVHSLESHVRLEEEETVTPMRHVAARGRIIDMNWRHAIETSLKRLRDEPHLTGEDLRQEPYYTNYIGQWGRCVVLRAHPGMDEEEVAEIVTYMFDRCMTANRVMTLERVHFGDGGGVRVDMVDV